MATVKDEKHTFELIEKILNLTSLNQHNQVSILEWCDALRSNTSSSAVIGSDALDPDDVKIEFNVSASKLQLVSQSTTTIETEITPNQLEELIGSVLSYVEQTMTNLEALPKRLRRLVTWQPSHSPHVSPSATVLPTNFTRTQQVFYSSIWQHFQTDPFAIRRGHVVWRRGLSGSVAI